MRNDLDSLNPGKAMAQAAHAQSVLDFHMMQQEDRSITKQLYNEWKSEEGRFGTTIVLGASIEQIEQLHERIDQIDCQGITIKRMIDPTYPIRDGEVTHLIPLHTCSIVLSSPAWVNLFAELELYP